MVTLSPRWLRAVCALSLTLLAAAEVRADGGTRTFQLGDPPEPVLVRAADVEVDAEGRLVRGVLAREQEVAGVPLPPGAVVRAAEGEVLHVESPHPVEAWGLRFAANKPIYPGSSPGGTLAADAAVGGLPLAGGTEVTLEFGHAPPRWEPAVVRGTLAGAHLVGGLLLPAGTELVRDCQHQPGGAHDLVHATLPRGLRAHGVAVSPDAGLEVHADGRFTATLAAPLRGGSGVELPAGARASFYPDGALLRARLPAALTLRGLTLAAGEVVELWPSGRLRRATLVPGSLGQPPRGPVAVGFEDTDSAPSYAFVRAPRTRSACQGAQGQVVAWLPSGAPVVSVRCGDAERLHRDLAATLAIGGSAGTHWPKGTRIAWEDDSEAGPVVALTSPEPHTVDGVRAAPDAPIHLDRQGRLVACTSAAAQTVDGVALAAGQRVRVRYDDRTGARTVVGGR